MIPKLSVLMPVYNAEEYLTESIDSILNQTFSDFELLIINDGSVDGSKHIIHSYSDARIRYLENDVNAGLIDTLNRGIGECRSDFIARMDADDIALPHRLSIQFNYLTANDKMGACGTYAQYIGASHGIWKYPITHEEIKCRLLWGSSIIHPTAMFRKEVLVKNNVLYNKSHEAAEDYKLWVDMASVTNLSNIPEVCLKYRVHKKQITALSSKMMNGTKGKIVCDQLISIGVPINTEDCSIVTRFVTFNYDFNLVELHRLFQIYAEFMIKNEALKRYSIQIINEQIKDRLFEATYFCSNKLGLKPIRLYKLNFEFDDVSSVKIMKAYAKGLFRI